MASASMNLSGITGTSSSGTSGSSSSTNFSAGGEDALRQLLAQLLSGGTAEQREQAAERRSEIGAVRGNRADYTKEAAFADAQGAVAQQSRLAMEKLLPSLVRSAEGAGTSQNSLRALLIQDAANKAAESSAALGLKASVDYGNISTGLSGVLEALTRPNNEVTKALIDSINLSKGQQSVSQSASGSASSRASDGTAYATRGGSPSQNWNSELRSSNLSGAPSDMMWASGAADLADRSAAQDMLTATVSNGVSTLWDDYSF